MEYLSLQGVFSSYAENAVRESEKKGYKLDYSIESLNTVEEILSATYKSYPKSRILRFFLGKSNNKLFEMAKPYGAYIGEVMRKKYGGQWTLEEFANRNGLPSLTIEKSKLHPTLRAYRRIKFGQEYDINQYVQVKTEEIIGKLV